jgi:hypothetical protein
MLRCLAVEVWPRDGMCIPAHIAFYVTAYCNGLEAETSFLCVAQRSPRYYVLFNTSSPSRSL